MRIGFDVSQTGSLKAGCGYLAASLIEALARTGGAGGGGEPDEYILYPSFGDFFWERHPKTCSHPQGGAVIRRGPLFYRFSSAKRFWKTPPPDFEARLGRPDIVHANNFFCPAGLEKARLVYTLYDLSFVEEPGWSKEDNRTGCFTGLFRASLLADALFSISRYTTEHFLRVFPHYPAERIVTAHLASRFSEDSPAAPPKTDRPLAPGEFWLSVGTIEPRKNHMRLFEAFARRLRGSGAHRPLVLAGGKGWLMEDVSRKLAELGIADKVLFTGYVSDAELAWLYANCRAFLYPSLFEGFGLPVLEAMSLGAAVIASKTTSIPEVTGQAGLLVDPLDVEDLARAMDRLDADDALRKRLGNEARERAREFSWELAAQKARQAYALALSLPRWAKKGEEGAAARESAGASSK